MECKINECGKVGTASKHGLCRTHFIEIQNDIIDDVKSRIKKRANVTPDFTAPRKTAQFSEAMRQHRKSKFWQDLRTLIINERKTCEACGGTKILQLHHNTYVNAGNEPPEDITLLCWEHHIKVHQLETKGMSLNEATATILQTTRKTTKHLLQ